MAKSQKRGNREARKPKKEKQEKAIENTDLPDRSVSKAPIPFGRKRKN